MFSDAFVCLRPCAWPLNCSSPVRRKVPRLLSQELGVQVCELCVCRSVGYKRQPIACCLWGSRKEHAESSQPMRCQSWRRSPPQETLGGVSGVQIINRLPNRHSWLFSLLIYPFLSLLTPFSSSSSIHLHSVFMLPPITTLMILNLWLDSFYFESIQPYIRLSTWVENYGGILSCTATVMSADMSAPSVKKKKSFARSSKPSTRMCIREQRDIM